MHSNAANNDTAAEPNCEPGRRVSHTSGSSAAASWWTAEWFLLWLRLASRR